MIEKSLSLPNDARQRERSNNPQDRPCERREKGLWSFLTWSFFLSQAVGAEQASAAAPWSAGVADDTAPTSDAAVGQANAVRPLNPVLAEIREAAADAPVQSLAQAVAPTGFLADARADAPTDMRSTEASSSARQTSAAPTTPVGVQPAANSAPTATPGPELGGDVPGVGDPPLPSIEIPPVVEEVIAPVVDIIGDVVDDVVEALDPVVEIVGDVVQVIDPVVEHVVAPVIGIVGDVVGDVVQVLDPVVEHVVAPVVGIVGDVLGDVVQVLDPVVEHVVAPVVGIVGDVVGDVVQVLDPVVEHVVAPVVGIVGDVVGDVVQVLDPVVEHVVAPVVGDVVGDVVQVLDPVVEHVVAPVVQALDPVVAPVVEALDPVVDQVLAPVADIVGAPLASLLGLGPGGGEPIILGPVVAASSGSIDFESPSAAGSLPIDQLFSGGSYTDYSLTLQGDNPVDASSTASTPLQDVADAVGNIVGTVIGTNPTDNGNGGHGSSHHIGLPSLLGDLGLHGLGL